MGGWRSRFFMLNFFLRFFGRAVFIISWRNCFKFVQIHFCFMLNCCQTSSLLIRISFWHFHTLISAWLLNKKEVVILSLDAHSPELSPLDTEMASSIWNLFAFSFYWISKGTLCAISNCLYEHDKNQLPICYNDPLKDPQLTMLALLWIRHLNMLSEKSL